MTMQRRDFLKAAAAVGTGTAALAAPGPAEAAREPKSMPPQAVGMLYDATLCVGCKACVSACKQANNLPPETDKTLAGWNEKTWDSPLDLSTKTYNIIKAYQHGTMATKDAETNGFSFVKRHCLHCVDPSCVSACPVTAMKKDATTGIVSYNPDACIGCRYCVYACPFGIPRFAYDTPTPKIGKCEFCRHLQAEGQTPACCHVCPTGASLFGLVSDLKEEAKRRLAAKPGATYVFPRGNLSGRRSFGEEDGGGGKAERRQERARLGFGAGKGGAEGIHRAGGSEPSQGTNRGHRQMPHEGKIGAYQNRLYGDKELGGTQVLYLSGVPIGKLGLPDNVPETSYAGISEGIQHTLYKGMIAPLVLLGGLVALAHRSTKGGGADEGEDEEPGATR